MTYLTKTSSILAAGLIAALVTGCGSDSKETTDSKSKSTSTSTDGAKSTESAKSDKKSTDSKDSKGGSGETLTIYSGRKKNLIEPILKDFTKDTGIKVDVKWGKTSDLALLLSEEGDKTKADMFISQSPGAIGFLAEKGLLGKVEKKTLDKVNKNFRGQDGNWVGLSGRVRCAIINTKDSKESDVPGSVFDLTDAKYKGKVGVAPGNGSFQDFVTAMRLKHGDDKTKAWLKGLKDNDAVTFKNNSTTIKGVDGGEAKIGLVNHYYNIRILNDNKDAKTKNVFFKDGDIGNLLISTGIAPLKASKKTEASNKLADYLTSKKAQTYFTTKTMEYPLADGIEVPKGLPPLKDVDYAAVDVNKLGGGLKGTLEMIEASGLGK